MVWGCDVDVVCVGVGVGVACKVSSGRVCGRRVCECASLQMCGDGWGTYFVPNQHRVAAAVARIATAVTPTTHTRTRAHAGSCSTAATTPRPTRCVKVWDVHLCAFVCVLCVYV